MIIYDLIFDTLKRNGFNVYAPNAHKGECIEPYIVVKESDTNQYVNYSTNITLYDIMCYAKNYTDCLKLKEKVKETMKKAEPSVKPTYTETAAFFDDSVKGYMSSVEYRNYTKQER